MNCGYGEKLILYFYGEADARLKADVAHWGPIVKATGFTPED